MEADLGFGEGNGELGAFHVGARIGAAGGVGEDFPVDGVADAFERADVDQAAIHGGRGSAAGAGEDSPAWMKLGQGHAAVGVEAERLPAQPIVSTAGYRLISPKRALVLCGDERTQIHALDRT